MCAYLFLMSDKKKEFAAEANQAANLLARMATTSNEGQNAISE